MTCRCRSGECDPECDGPVLRAEIERLRSDVDFHLNTVGTLTTENERLRAVLREDRKYLAGLCGCAASSGCGAAIRRVEIDRLLNSEQKAADKRGKNE